MARESPRKGIKVFLLRPYETPKKVASRTLSKIFKILASTGPFLSLSMQHFVEWLHSVPVQMLLNHMQQRLLVSSHHLCL